MAQKHPIRQHCCVLNRTKFKEHDLILTLLSETGEQLSVLARGARKPQSKFCAHCDFGCVSDMLLVPAKNKLLYLREAQLIHTYKSIHRDIFFNSAFLLLLEATRFCTFEEYQDRVIFQMLVSALQALDEIKEENAACLLLAAYLLKLASHAGWMPQLNACALCSDDTAHYLSLKDGGVVCRQCADGSQLEYLLSVQEIQWLTTLLWSKFKDISLMKCPRELSQKMLRIAHEWFCFNIECELKTTAYILGLW